MRIDQFDTSNWEKIGLIYSFSTHSDANWQVFPKDN